MSYPAFGKVKTIVLPCLMEGYSDTLTIKEYKNKFGIDLTEILRIDGSYISLKANAQILLQPYGVDPYVSCLMPITKYNLKPQTEQLPAELVLWAASTNDFDYFGIYFHIDQNTEMKVENIKIDYVAI